MVLETKRGFEALSGDHCVAWFIDGLPSMRRLRSEENHRGIHKGIRNGICQETLSEQRQITSKDFVLLTKTEFLGSRALGLSGDRRHYATSTIIGGLSEKSVTQHRVCQYRFLHLLNLRKQRLHERSSHLRAGKVE